MFHNCPVAAEVTQSCFKFIMLSVSCSFVGTSKKLLDTISAVFSQRNKPKWEKFQKLQTVQENNEQSKDLQKTMWSDPFFKNLHVKCGVWPWTCCVEWGPTEACWTRPSLPRDLWLHTTPLASPPVSHWFPAGLRLQLNQHTQHSRITVIYSGAHCHQNTVRFTA